MDFWLRKKKKIYYRINLSIICRTVCKTLRFEMFGGKEISFFYVSVLRKVYVGILIYIYLLLLVNRGIV